MYRVRVNRFGVKTKFIISRVTKFEIRMKVGLVKIFKYICLSPVSACFGKFVIVIQYLLIFTCLAFEIANEYCAVGRIRSAKIYIYFMLFSHVCVHVSLSLVEETKFDETDAPNGCVYLMCLLRVAL